MIIFFKAEYLSIGKHLIILEIIKNKNVIYIREILTVSITQSRLSPLASSFITFCFQCGTPLDCAQ